MAQQTKSCFTILSLSDAKILISLCRQGKLYEVEKWISEDKSLQVPPGCKTTPLQIALERGFHSLVELLTRNEVDQQAKNSALSEAVSRHHLEIVELLVNHGAQISAVPFSHVLLNWDPRLIRYFLDRGADFITDAPFTEAFTGKIRTALRPFLECKRSHPELMGELQKQVDAALRYFCNAGNEKWVSLMLWAGADPRSLGPSPGDPDEPDYYTTALRLAAHNGNVKILKMLKPQLGSDNISELVHYSAMFGRADSVAFFLELRPNLNDKSNGGSSALDGSLWNLGFERAALFFGKRQRAIYEVRSSLDQIQKLVEYRALWKPNDASAINSLRRTLFNCEPSVTVELLRLFRKHDACSDETLQKLLRTPRMKSHLASVENRFPRWPTRKKQNRDADSKKAEARTPLKVGEPLRPSYILLHKYDRDVLYEEVWKHPVQQLAKKYGISDVGLGKACRKLGVPLPGLGYWAKKAAGKKVPKRPPMAALQPAWN